MDKSLIREMGELGLMGVDLPEQYGGLGASGVTAGVIAEELAYGDFNVSAVPVGVSLLGAVIMSSATPKLAEYWIPRMIRGETLMGVCVTEPSTGSDAGAMKLRCRRDGDHYVLDGEKTSITFADCADAFIVFARTGDAGERRRWSHRADRARRYAGNSAHAFQRCRQPHHRPRFGVLRGRAGAGRKSARRMRTRALPT